MLEKELKPNYRLSGIEIKVSDSTILSISMLRSRQYTGGTAERTFGDENCSDNSQDPETCGCQPDTCDCVYDRSSSYDDPKETEIRGGCFDHNPCSSD